MPRLSLRAKLLAVVLLPMGPILGLLLYSFQAAHARERALVLDDLTQTARSVGLLDTSFRDALTLAELLAGDLALRTLDPTQATPTLQRIHRHYPGLENLEVVNASGDEVAAAVRPPGAPPRNLARERHFQQVMATGAPALSGVLVSPDTGRPIVVAAAPLTDPSGRHIGAVLVSLRAASVNVGAALVALQLGALEDRLETTIVAPDQAIFVADPSGTLAFHTDLADERWHARDVSGWSGFEAARAGQTVRTTDFRSPLTGDVQVAVLAPTPGFGWVVGVTWSVEEAFGTREQALRRQLLAFATIVLLAVAAAIALAALLTRPIARLAAEARALGRGDLGRRVAVRTGDELEMLGEAFNRMAADLQAVLQHMPAGVMIAEACSGRLLVANEQVGQIWRRPLSPTAAAAGDWQRLAGVHPDGRPYAPAEWPLARSIRTGETVVAEEIEILREDGSRGTVRVSSAPIRDQDGVIVAGVATVYDITERRRAEGAIRFLADVGALLGGSLDYEATLAQVARVAVPRLADWCIVDVVEPDRSIRRVGVAHADPAKEDLLRELRRRYQPEVSWETHPVTRVVRSGQPEVVPEVSHGYLASMARDATHLGMLRELSPRSFMCVPLLARGRALGAITLATTETGRHYGAEDVELAKELARRAGLAVENARLYREAERALRVRDEFLASASHELRTPLAHIKGFVSTLRQTDVEWDDETRLEFLAETERETDRLAGLIGDLLDMSRLESGGPDIIDRGPTRLAGLVAGGLDRVRGLLSGHPVHVDVPEDLPGLSVDASQIERVVGNLVENAAKYSLPGTPVRISGAQVNGGVELRVEDEGPGIPEEHLGRVFEKFYRVRSDGSPVAGTGLGLAICRRIVQAHGGRIWAENRPEGGARLVVRLPPEWAAEGELR